MWYGKNRKHYPIVLTRDMDKARVWLHSKTRGRKKLTDLLVKLQRALSRWLFVYLNREIKMMYIVFWRIEIMFVHQTISKMQQQKFKCKNWNWISVLWDADVR